MKLIIAIVQERDRQRVSDALLQAGHQFTVVASTGGFLRDGNTTFLIGAKVDVVDDIINLVGSVCKAREQYVNQPMPDIMGAALISPVKVTVGGAIIFVVNVEQFERA